MLRAAGRELLFDGWCRIFVGRLIVGPQFCVLVFFLIIRNDDLRFWAAGGGTGNTRVALDFSECAERICIVVFYFAFVHLTGELERKCSIHLHKGAIDMLMRLAILLHFLGVDWLWLEWTGIRPIPRHVDTICILRARLSYRTDSWQTMDCTDAEFSLCVCVRVC